MKNLNINELYVFHTTDPDDDRVDNAFIGQVLEVTDRAVRVQTRRLCPTDDREGGERRLNLDAYAATPLPLPTDPVWEDVAKLLVPPEGWPATLKTLKGQAAGEPAVRVASVHRLGDGRIRLTVDVTEVPRQIAAEVARLLLQASRQ